MQHRASDNPDTGLDPEVAGRVPGASGGRRWEVADFRELPGKVREFPDRVQPGSSRPRSSRSRTGPYNSWTQSGTRELPNLVLAASGCPKLDPLALLGDPGPNPGAPRPGPKVSGSAFKLGNDIDYQVDGRGRS